MDGEFYFGTFASPEFSLGTDRKNRDDPGRDLVFDRVVITGSLPDIGHGQAMEAYLRYHKVLLKDYPRWAEPSGHLPLADTSIGVSVAVLPVWCPDD